MYYLVLRNSKPIGLYTSIVDALKISRNMDKYIIYKMICNTEDNEVYKIVNPLKPKTLMILDNLDFDRSKDILGVG